MSIHFNDIERIAAGQGLALVGAVAVDRLRPALERASAGLKVWQDGGFAGEMAYMNRPAELFAEPENFLPGARTVLSFAVPYFDPAEGAEQACPPGFGRVARYARSRDYHRVLKKVLRRLVAEIEAALGRRIGWRAFSDAVPFFERAVASAAGLGFPGKNTMLIRPKAGSYFFLAELLLDQSLDLDGQTFDPGRQSHDLNGQSRDLVRQSCHPDGARAGGPVRSTGCGSCVRCQVGCPTGAFIAPGRLDARRCISYLTIEKRGGFSAVERSMLGDWVFGCDRCQEVCPFNHRAVSSPPLEQFKPEQGVGAQVDLGAILAISSDSEFLFRFSGTPLMRPGRVGMTRNALAVTANQRNCALIPQIIDLLQREQSQMLRDEALAALAALSPYSGRSRQITALIGALSPQCG